jgi:hypothetical protein
MSAETGTKKSSTPLMLGIVIVILIALLGVVFYFENNQITGLQSSLATTNSSLQTMTAQYNSLNVQYSALQSNYTALNGQYDELNDAYQSLSSNFTSLNSQYLALGQQYQALQTQNTNLSNIIALKVHSNFVNNETVVLGTTSSSVYKDWFLSTPYAGYIVIKYNSSVGVGLSGPFFYFFNASSIPTSSMLLSHLDALYTIYPLNPLDYGHTSGEVIIPVCPTVTGIEIINTYSSNVTLTLTIDYYY